MADPNQAEGSTYVRPKHFGKIEIIKKDASGAPVVYLRRWYLWRCKAFSVRIHHIMLPDLDRDPHDHPWPFLSIILKGGYREHWCPVEQYTADSPHHMVMNKMWLGFFTRHIGWYSFHRSTDLHAIQAFDNGRDVWTLFLTGRESRVVGIQDTAGLGSLG